MGREKPVWKLKHDTSWMNPATGAVVTFPKWTEYIKLNYYHYTRGDSANKRFDFNNVINRHPEIANGWTRESLGQMRDFLAGTAIILGGYLRVLPLPAVSIPVSTTVSATRHLLEIAEEHICAGRVPVLQDSTKAKLLDKAKEYERQRYGRELQPEMLKNPQASLFE